MDPDGNFVAVATGGVGAGVYIGGVVLIAVVGAAVAEAKNPGTIESFGDVVSDAFDRAVDDIGSLLDRIFEKESKSDDAGAEGDSNEQSGDGSIYVVPGSGTESGKPYIGRHNKPNPQKTRRSQDGRDRSKAKKIDSYDSDKINEGRLKEQQAIDRAGGVKKLDNKRNEIAPRKKSE